MVKVLKDAITKTRLYNLDPLKPHFYIVKLGFIGALFFLLLLKNIDCGYSLEPPRRGGSNEYQQSMFWAEIWKISFFFIWIFFNFWRWNLLYIWIGCFRNAPHHLLKFIFDLLNPRMPSGLFYLISSRLIWIYTVRKDNFRLRGCEGKPIFRYPGIYLDQSISNKKGVWFYINSCI